jgi:hypothetical protein
MPYLIKAVSTSGVVTWLTRPGQGGLPLNLSREDVLSSLEDATAEIARVTPVFEDAGIKFSVVETPTEG